MDSFLNLYGNYSVSSLVVVITSLLFVYNLYVKVKSFFENSYQEKKEKEDLIKKTYDTVNSFSISIKELKEKQEELKENQDELREKLEEHSKKLEKIDQNSRQRELNTTRDRLLQSYRYYTSKEKNPLQVWTEMESQAFWDMYTDYEELGGNGYLHSEVQPAMIRLEVISMEDTERIQELFKTRR